MYKLYEDQKKYDSFIYVANTFVASLPKALDMKNQGNRRKLIKVNAKNTSFMGLYSLLQHANKWFKHTHTPTPTHTHTMGQLPGTTNKK